jgi:hypothetical protein
MHTSFGLKLNLGSIFLCHELHPQPWSWDILVTCGFRIQIEPKLSLQCGRSGARGIAVTQDKGSYDPVQSVKMAKEVLVVLSIPKMHAGVLPEHGWRLPDDDIIKLNTAIGLALDARRGGAGGVVRSQRNYLGAWSKQLFGITNLLIAQALALREGVIFANLHGFQKVVLEMDCLEVVNLWNTRHGSCSVVTRIMQEIGELALNFSLLFSM